MAHMNPIIIRSGFLGFGNLTPEDKQTVSSLDTHYKGRRVKPNRERERKLVLRFQAGDEGAMDSLTAMHMRFVIGVAFRYVNQGVALSDLINEGWIGFREAVKRFDVNKGTTLISYAVWWVRQSILAAISKQSRVVRLPQNICDAKMKLRSAQDQFVRENERRPQESELAEQCDFGPRKMMWIRRWHHAPLSLDYQIENDGDGTALHEVVADVEAPRPDAELHKEDLRSQVSELLDEITDQRERFVVESYFGLRGRSPQTLESIGEKLGLSRERVRQIREKTLMRLRSRISEHGELISNPLLDASCASELRTRWHLVVKIDWRLLLQFPVPDECTEDEEAAIQYVESFLWPRGPMCPRCGKKKKVCRVRVKHTPGRADLYNCPDCKRQFNVKTGTIFQRSKVGLRHWLWVISRLNSNGRSLRIQDLQRRAYINYVTAQKMLVKIRQAIDELNESRKERDGYGPQWPKKSVSVRTQAPAH